MTSSAGRDTSGFRSPEKKQKNAATFAPDVTFPIAVADVQLGFSCHGLHKYLLAMPQCHAYVGWLT